jgi:hypothetical protein
MTMGKIRHPPMVGVPALSLWLGGPSSRMTWPICMALSRWMTQFPKMKMSTREESVATMVRKVMYRNTFSQDKSVWKR